jgi:hypothetical protein
VTISYLHQHWYNALCAQLNNPFQKGKVKILISMFIEERKVISIYQALTMDQTHFMYINVFSPLNIPGRWFFSAIYL